MLNIGHHSGSHFHPTTNQLRNNLKRREKCNTQTETHTHTHTHTHNMHAHLDGKWHSCTILLSCTSPDISNVSRTCQFHSNIDTMLNKNTIATIRTKKAMQQIIKLELFFGK